MLEIRVSRRVVESMGNVRTVKDSGLEVALSETDNCCRGCLIRTAVCILRRQMLRGGELTRGARERGGRSDVDG